MKKTSYLAEREEDSFKRHCRLSELLIGEDQHVFDVGANIGQSVSRYRDKFPNCFITSFEPNPQAFSLLERSWGGVPGVTLNQIALADYTGHASFFRTRVSAGSSLLKPTERIIELSSECNYDYETINVPTMTLDHYCQIHNVRNIDILKMDVQGSELGVLQGAEKLLREGMIKLIYSEVILAETYENQTRFVDIVSYLNKLNYEIWDIGSFLYTRNDRIWAANLIFVHTSAANLLEAKPKYNCEIEHDSI